MGRPWVCQVGGATIIGAGAWCYYTCAIIDHEWMWFYQQNARNPLDRDCSIIVAKIKWNLQSSVPVYH